MSQVNRLWDDLRTNYWFVPALMALTSIWVAFALVRLDQSLRDEVVRELGWIYTGGPEGARSVLSVIAGSVIGVAGTTFSITIAVLSLASGQYGPHLLRGFLRDTGNQVVLGAFTSTFLYCLLVLRTVRGTEQTTYVPHLSVTFGVVLALADVGVLIYFIHHVSESIQVSNIIERVGKELDRAIERLFPEDVGTKEGENALPVGLPDVVASERSGYVVAVDTSALLHFASRSDLVVKLLARPGEHVVEGQPLMSVWLAGGGPTERLRRAFAISHARTTIQDAEYAFMQLSEIGIRALSPGTNDPFTAIACVDRLTASMCRLAKRGYPSEWRHDKRGRLRIVANPYPYSRLVEAAFGHIRQAASNQPAVLERLRNAIGVALSCTRNRGLATALEAEHKRLGEAHGEKAAGLVGP
ncbi:DUF2254 domain-containing protein [bacterium]|nr:MAG: DUF2254 domain-containing protein [bacterium]